MAQRVTTHDLKGCFKVWFHVVKFSMLKRQHQRYAAKLRRRRFEETLQLASLAAGKHDTHKLFDIINRHAPKTPKRRMQLRSPQGALMTLDEERSMLISFVEKTWHGDPLTPMHPITPPGVPFTLPELTEALYRIPSVKAVAPPCAPGMIWTSHCATIAPILFDLLSKWWGTSEPWIPHMWRNGWLQLIPKPGRPPVRPENLRPLALQCPLGKAVFGLLIHHASLQTAPEFRTWPIWAFMPLRSTQDPLTKVALHCRATKSLVDSQKSTPHTRAALAPRLTCYGGLQVFIDLEKAFDSVNRAKLFSKLHILQIDDNIICLLRNWHVDTSYFLTHGGVSTEVKVTCGRRQGCKGAPFLWNCLVVLMLHTLQTKVTIQWIREHLSIYADDINVGGIFRNLQELLALLDAIGILIQTLHDFDLRTNPSKSTAIFTIHGHQGVKTRAKLTVKDLRGEHLKVPMPDGTEMLIPLQQKANYLGCILGYHNFEDVTTWHRMKLARIGFSRLKRWLCNKTHFGIKQRFQLWRTCILPIYTYGTFAVDVTPKGIQHMIVQTGMMLRSIARDHSHHTGHTNEQVFQFSSFPHPAELLTSAVETLQQSIAQRNLRIPADDIAWTLDWSHLPAIIAKISSAQATLALHRTETALSGEVLGTDHLYFCQLCNFSTNHIPAFRRHCTAAYGMHMFRSFPQSINNFTTDGLPTCRYCKTQFATWRSFQNHIERGCQALLLGPAPCTGVENKVAMATSLRQPRVDVSVRGTELLTEADLSQLRAMPWGPRVLALIADDNLSALERDQEACSYLSKHCFICGQHAHRIQDLHLHFRTAHAQYWTNVSQKALVLTNLHSSETPCPHCGSGFKTHQCPVWVQMAVLILHGGGLAAPPEDLQAVAGFRCDICLQPFTSAALLTQHLQTTHKLAGLRSMWQETAWIPSRHAPTVDLSTSQWRDCVGTYSKAGVTCSTRLHKQKRNRSQRPGLQCAFMVKCFHSCSHL